MALAVGTSSAEAIKVTQHLACKTEYYKTLYYIIVPADQRAPSFSEISKRSRRSHSESQGVTRPLQRDPPGGDPGTWASAGITRLTALGQSSSPRPSGHIDMGH